MPLCGGVGWWVRIPCPVMVLFWFFCGTFWVLLGVGWATVHFPIFGINFYPLLGVIYIYSCFFFFFLI